MSPRSIVVSSVSMDATVADKSLKPDALQGRSRFRDRNVASASAAMAVSECIELHIWTGAANGYAGAQDESQNGYAFDRILAAACSVQTCDT